MSAGRWTTEDQAVAAGHGLPAAGWQAGVGGCWAGWLAGLAGWGPGGGPGRWCAGGWLAGHPSTVGRPPGTPARPPPTAREHPLAGAVWDHDAVRDDVGGCLVDHLGEEGAVLVVDETGGLKQGSHTVGVGRQDTGTAGKVDTPRSPSTWPTQLTLGMG